MNEFENNNQNTGNISGFDSAENNAEGYTVTPQGGFYNHKSADIIQDEVVRPQPQESAPNASTATPPPYTPPVQNEAYYGKPPRAPRPKKAKKQHSTSVVIVCCVLAAVIGAASGIAAITGLYMLDGKTNTENIITADPSGNSTNVNINIDEVAESVVEAVAVKASDSVVGIRTTTSVVNFFGGSQSTSGDGSGVVYTKDGYIITNYHVVEGAINGSSDSKIEVFLENNATTSYEASVVGYNISCDLAVLKINANNLKPVELGTTDELKVGQYVVTIGAPGGLEFMGSVTYGVISGLDRVVSTDSDLKLIQTDAAINPGNSGGALLNTKGQLIGINSSKIVSEEFEGMGFAIPINTVKEKCDKIISRQNKPEAYIGVSISERYTSQVLSYYGYPAGAVVSGVVDGSPADKAGIERGDIITEFGGTKIKEYTVLDDVLHDLDPGDTVSLSLYRAGRSYSLEITVGSNG